MKTEWFWCLHCERAFESKVPDDYTPEKPIEEIGQMCLNEDGDEWWRCPYRGCDGTTLDLWHWAEVREHHPDYPEKPQLGKVYPLYDEEKAPPSGPSLN